MYLMYLDESGNTGTDYDNKQQPIFSLAGICVEDCKWHEVNDTFEKEKIKICPEFKDYEIHAMELFNSPRSSVFNKYSWTENINILEKIVNLITSLDIVICNNTIDKQGLKKHFSYHFSNSVKINPYLYAFGNMYYYFNDVLLALKSYGIIFTDEMQSVSERTKVALSKIK